MTNWKAIGVMLQDASERALVMDAAVSCGLEPVAVVAQDPAMLYRSAQKSNRLDSGRESRPVESRWLPIIVADEQAPLMRWKAEAQARSMLSSAILMVQERSADPFAAAGIEEPAYAWVLERPLGREAVRTQLLHAVRANRVFLGQHRRVLEELNRSQAIFESVANGIAVSDATSQDMPLVYVNPAFESMTGYQANEVLGRNCRFLQGDERDQAAIAEVRQAIQRRQSAKVLLRNFRKDGTFFWNELYLSPIQGLDGHIESYVGIQNDVTERVNATERLRYLALHDGLTGLANRTLLLEQFERALQRARRAGKIVAVLFFDLNNFKQLNDTLGHEAGDQLLKTVATRLRETARSCETVARLESMARLGGDEFVVVLEGLPDDVIHELVIRRFLKQLSEPTEVRGSIVVPTASVGAALFPRDGDSVEELLRAADAAMYRAKRAGDI